MPSAPSDAHQHVLALVDLSLPRGADPEQLIEAVARSCLLLQAVQQCRTSLAYNVLCSSKADYNQALTTLKGLQLRGKRRNCGCSMQHAAQGCTCSNAMHAVSGRRMLLSAGLWRVITLTS